MAIPSIKNPCPEKWENMNSEEQGRFCGKCATIVIDFTKKTTQEIIDFLTARKGEDICGKLRAPKLQPIAIPVSKRTRLFSVAALLAFGSMLFTACGPSEEEQPIGKVGIDSATEAQNQHYSDSIAHADSIKSADSSTSSQTTNIDSAKMVEMMKVLDSVSALKKKSNRN